MRTTTTVCGVAASICTASPITGVDVGNDATVGVVVVVVNLLVGLPITTVRVRWPRAQGDVASRKTPSITPSLAVGVYPVTSSISAVPEPSTAPSLSFPVLAGGRRAREHECGA